jgi:hypothetical protein
MSGPRTEAGKVPPLSTAEETLLRADTVDGWEGDPDAIAARIWATLDREREASVLDVDVLAAALRGAFPGYQRWLSWPVTTYREAMARDEAMVTVARIHAAAIAAEYRRLIEEARK